MKKYLFLLLFMAVFGYSGVAVADLIVIGTATSSLLVPGTLNPQNSPLSGGTESTGYTYQLIYDSAQELVWLDYSNENATWQEQNAWAAGLGEHLTVNLDPSFETDIDWFSGWRLPQSAEDNLQLEGPYRETATGVPLYDDILVPQGYGWWGPDESGEYDYNHGFNMVNSEMGRLYYESLGNLGYLAEDGTSPQPDWGLQTKDPFNNLFTEYYWSETPHPQDAENATQAWRFNMGSGIQGRSSTSTIDDPPFEVTRHRALAVRPGIVTNVTPVPEPGTMALLCLGLAGLAVWLRKLRR